MTLIIIILIWYIIGLFSFIYWWTRDYNFTTKELPTCLFASILGPITFLVGAGIHGKIVIFRKRK